jgi:hypothetical protein
MNGDELHHLHNRSGLLHPPEGWVMATLHAYFDDSGKANDPQHELIAVAGYVGSVEAWDAAGKAWKKVLDGANLPYLHMKHFAHFAKPFDALRARPEVAEKLLDDLISVIRGSGLYGVGSIVRLPHIKKFNAEKTLELCPLAIGLYGACLEIYLKFPSDDIEVVMDRVEKPYLLFNEVQGYGETDRHYKSCLQRIQFAVIPPVDSFRNIPAIQMADLAAWESRRAHSMQTAWYDMVKPSNDPKLWMPSLANWQLQKFGKFPAERPSFSQIVRAASLEGIVWDYPCMMSAHEARGGSWRPGK